MEKLNNQDTMLMIMLSTHALMDILYMVIIVVYVNKMEHGQDLSQSVTGKYIMEDMVEVMVDMVDMMIRKIMPNYNTEMLNS